MKKMFMNKSSLLSGLYSPLKALNDDDDDDDGKNKTGMVSSLFLFRADPLRQSCLPTFHFTFLFPVHSPLHLQLHCLLAGCGHFFPL